MQLTFKKDGIYLAHHKLVSSNCGRMYQAIFFFVQDHYLKKTGIKRTELESMCDGAILARLVRFLVEKIGLVEDMGNDTYRLKPGIKVQFSNNH